ncbi:hypothetical protein CC2G_012795 [Coprinopsis cinerea AmutBmut pab1-1]|nr:hypothetical protein CC2G_012795 [Coprinopsis cinerea AmutBmut pab1-1]
MTFAMETPTSCTTTVLADLDPDSLRAKALSTLRAKRKRPAAQLPIISLPSRPIHQADAMQLDYGQDDSSPPSVQQSQEKPAAVVTQEPTAKPDVDVSMREEGEISDEEEEPAPKPPHRTTAAIAAQDSFKYSIGSKPSLLDRLTDPQPQPPPPHMVHGLPRKPVTSALPPRPPPTQPRSALQISEEQVRPNLHMTQAEYDKAKDIILDLLGWGVPPHYLVDCGLTREMVFYVFNELNLRLPSNLDTTGLMPYSPETIHTFSVVPPGPSRPPVPASPAQPSPVSRKPEGPSPIESVATLSLPATPTPAQQKHLDEVESLKKQELMARKQALASRRRRPVAQPAEKLVPIENTPDASVTAAEDFLKSITPTGRVPPSPMDLVADSRVPSSPSEQTGKGASFTPSPAVLEPPPSSTESVTTTFNKTMRLSPRQSSVPEKSPTTDRPPPTPQYPVRKATRRPVASDFVDLDGHARSITRASSHDGAQSTYNQQPPRSATSFISNVRPVRCVIDLSDSESEEEEAPVPPQKRHNGMKSSSATPSISTAMLEEKEREIQRMREEIAKREQESLLKKLGLKSGPVASNGHSPAPSTSVPTPGAAIPTPPPPTANESPTVSSTQPPRMKTYRHRPPPTTTDNTFSWDLHGNAFRIPSRNIIRHGPDDGSGSSERRRKDEWNQ